MLALVTLPAIRAVTLRHLPDSRLVEISRCPDEVEFHFKRIVSRADSMLNNIHPTTDVSGSSIIGNGRSGRSHLWLLARATLSK